MKYFCLFLILFSLVLAGCGEREDVPGSFSETSSKGSSSEPSFSTSESLETSSLTQSEKQQQILASADNDTPCHKLITQKIDWVSEKDFRNFAYRLYMPRTSYSPRIDWINSAYPIECLRDMGDGRRYAVYHMKDGGRCFFFFNDSEFFNFAYISKTKQKKDFKGIQVGDSFEKVVAADPDARIWQECPFDYSAHLLKDGILVYEYREGIITDIKVSADFIYRKDYNSGRVEYDYSILSQDYPS